jgi:hypothetical protein
MRIDERKYAKFEYNDGHSGDHTKNPFQRGDVVIKHKTFQGDVVNEIGVVLQVHDEFELRTDMFGNEGISTLTMATDEEIKKFRPKLLVD